jgi:hypothetical protein
LPLAGSHRIVQCGAFAPARLMLRFT